MNLDHLGLFHAVLRRGSFAGAARERGLDPSAVSRAVAALEASLGVRLLERSTRALAPTEAGAVYARRTAGLVAALEEAGAEARDLTSAPRGTLRISASTAFGEAVIVPMLPAFLAAHPQLSVDLVLSDAPLDLLAESLDAAVRLTPDAPPDTRIRRLARTRYRVVAAPAWAEANPLSRPEDLSGVAAIRFPFPGHRDAWMVRDADGARSIPVGGRLVIRGAAALRRAALDGLGPALLADWLVGGDLAEGRLRDLFPGAEFGAGGFDSAAWFLTPSAAYRPLKTTLFARALATAMTGRRGDEMEREGN